MKNLPNISRNAKYRTARLLDHFYHQKYYKLIGIALSKQANTSLPQKINFVGKLEENDGSRWFHLAEMQLKNYMEFSFSVIKGNRKI